MDQRIADLLALLELETLEVNLFRGESRDIGSPQVFGGQVLGQALNAASRTVSGRIVHSLHAYFLRRGDFKAPIIYQVDRSRDGHSFSNRRVVAIQHGEQIFNMTCSFQVPESGLEHQVTIPDVPGPEGLADTSRVAPELLAKLPERVRRLLETARPFEFRAIGPLGTLPAPGFAPARRVWFRAVAAVPEEQTLQRCLLAYVSDFHLLETATAPHGISHLSGKAQVASIDHAMWFHRSLRVDDWLLYDVESPSASGARGFARANVFARDGTLVASTAQEGLVRVMDPAP
ncbi:MAG TPA: acyl-CoA thioesterase II [Steroidobacteraceae bacterium]|nr:acyl-CoA thioesterase II [Steroidobacteraceae bacterium]